MPHQQVQYSLRNVANTTALKSQKPPVRRRRRTWGFRRVLSFELRVPSASWMPAPRMRGAEISPRRVHASWGDQHSRSSDCIGCISSHWQLEARLRDVRSNELCLHPMASSGTRQSICSKHRHGSIGALLAMIGLFSTAYSRSRFGMSLFLRSR